MDAAKKDLAMYVKTWSDKHSMSSEEVLALLAYMTGGAIAMQDQRTMTSERAQTLVLENIEAGNMAVIASLIEQSANRDPV